MKGKQSKSNVRRAQNAGRENAKYGTNHEDGHHEEIKAPASRAAAPRVACIHDSGSLGAPEEVPEKFLTGAVEVGLIVVGEVVDVGKSEALELYVVSSLPLSPLPLSSLPLSSLPLSSLPLSSLPLSSPPEPEPVSPSGSQVPSKLRDPEQPPSGSSPCCGCSPPPKPMEPSVCELQASATAEPRIAQPLILARVGSAIVVVAAVIIATVVIVRLAETKRDTEQSRGKVRADDEPMVASGCGIDAEHGNGNEAGSSAGVDKHVEGD